MVMVKPACLYRHRPPRGRGSPCRPTPSESSCDTHADGPPPTERLGDRGRKRRSWKPGGLLVKRAGAAGVSHIRTPGGEELGISSPDAKSEGKGLSERGDAGLPMRFGPADPFYNGAGKFC